MKMALEVYSTAKLLCRDPGNHDPQSVTKGRCIMADFLRVAGIVQLIGGLLLGILMGNMDGMPLFGGDGQFTTDFRWSVGLFWWIAGVIGGIVFLALSLLFEAIGRIESNVYSLTTAYFRQNPSEALPSKPLGTSRSSLTKMTNYKMGRTEE